MTKDEGLKLSPQSCEYLKYLMEARLQPLTEDQVDSFYRALRCQELSRQFNEKNWFQAGFTTAEAVHNIRTKHNE
jgi:hypothetical protein